MRFSAIGKRRRTCAAYAALALLIAGVAGCAAGDPGAEEGDLLAAGHTWIDGYYHGAAAAEELHKLFTDSCQDEFPVHEFWAVHNLESRMEREITDVAADVTGDTGEIRFTLSGAFPDLVDTGVEEVVMPWRFEKGEWRNADCIADSN